MVDPLSGWKSRLLAMPPVNTATAGVQNLADFLGDEMDKVEAQGGSPGIFTFDRPLFVSTLLSSGFGPTAGNEWAGKLATAWMTASGSATITAGTVTNGAWTASVTDIQTSPSGSSTIVTLSSAKTFLENTLLSAASTFASVTNPSQGDAVVDQVAGAFRDATLMFQFNCIGLAIAVPSPIPVPIVLPAS